MQVHAHDLRAVVRFHKGPPIVVDDVDTSSMNARDSYGEREAPLLHGIRSPGVRLPPFPFGVLRDQFPLGKLIELVQIDAAEQRRDHAALRGAAKRVMVLPVFQVPGLEHVADQPEKPVIADSLRQDPEKDLMVKTAEAVGDATLDKPHRPGPGLLYFPQRGMAASPFPETVRPARESRFVVRLKEQAHHLADELI